jgi:hypothetical protein
MKEELIKMIGDKIKEYTDLKKEDIKINRPDRLSVYTMCIIELEEILTELKKQNEKSCENCEFDNSYKYPMNCNNEIIINRDGIACYKKISYCSNYKEVGK